MNPVTSEPTFPPTTAIADTVVVVNQAKVEFGPETLVTACPQCQRQVQTEIQFEVGMFTVLLCILFGCFVCCCDCTKDAVHLCPNCHMLLGRYKRGC